MTKLEYNQYYHKINAKSIAQRKRRYYLKYRHKKLAYKKEYTAKHYLDTGYRIKIKQNAFTQTYKHLGFDFGVKDQLIHEQKGLCFICKNNGTYFDHCHKTNYIRGLLCATCNLGIGYLKDSPILLKRAAQYVG